MSGPALGSVSDRERRSKLQTNADTQGEKEKTMNHNELLSEDLSAEELIQALPADPAGVKDAAYTHDVGGEEAPMKLPVNSSDPTPSTRVS